ncbi:hypothetical protein [Sulfuriferula nivalis]|uniref:Uncharacterized protein n=1 Tax=Sulfuriferula nivalis TaxID=2675298 RepID=A0A809SBU6_9PROT|nr:hypothetical protein [Sulfuriferula nivalis]BBP02562.1 hypothetical protein SFSGTM_32700 [Sulfuriferula nivalis]
MKFIMGHEAETKPVLTGTQKVNLAITAGVIGLLVATHGHKLLSAHAYAVVLSVIAFTVIALLLKAIPARAAKKITEATNYTPAAQEIQESESELLSCNPLSEPSDDIFAVGPGMSISLQDYLHPYSYYNY